MLAILGGVGAAAAWAASTLCAARASRILGAPPVLAWVALVGLLIVGPVALAEGVPARLDASALGWLAIAGVGNVIGLLVAYLAYRIGDVALIAPVVSTEGAIAALVALAAGERIGIGVAVTLAVIAVGISLAAIPNSPRASVPGIRPAPVVALAAGAAACFGASLYATGRISTLLPLAWVVLPARLLGALAVALPLALMGRLRVSTPALSLLVAAGVCEVLGFASFALGARHDIAVAAVLSCQFAAISAIAAYVLFGERLARPQLAGVLVVIVGVTTLSGLRA